MAKANKWFSRRSFWIALAAAFMLPSMVRAAPSVVTQMYDRGHTGWNRNETQLTVANVKSGFKLLFKNATDGQTYSQPLYIPGLKMGTLGTHNVIFLATEHNTVYAFDADVPGAPLWSRNLTPTGETLQTASDYNNTRIPVIGITGTPVIDPVSSTLYAVAASKTLSAPTVFHQRLHALDISTGSERANSPVDIHAKYPGTGGIQDGKGNVVFDPRRHFNRPALLRFANKVYIAFGSHEDVGAYQGWVMAYDKTSLAQVAVFNTSPNLPAGTGGGSIWQASIGLVADSTSIYALTANGLFDVNIGGSNYGDTALRLGPTLNVADYFTPCDQEFLDAGDHDLGASGAMILPDQITSPSQLVTFAGKEGSIYLADRTDMGGYTPTDVPFDVPCTDRVVQKLWRVLGTNHTGVDVYWGAPAYFQDASGHQYVYYTGDYSPITEFDLANGALAAGTVAGGKPNQTPGSTYNFPHGGTIPEISSNGGDPATAILWAIKHAPPPEDGYGPVTLDAFAATDLTNQLVFDIPAGSWNFHNDPFLIPTIVNGKVYVASGGELDVFGSPGLGPSPTPVATPTPGGKIAVSTGTLTLPKAGLGGAPTHGSFTIQNTSARHHLVGNVGSAASPFSVVLGGGGFDLPPVSAPMPVKIRFTPTALGLQAGSVVVTSNDAANPSVTVNLKGRGRPGVASLAIPKLLEPPNPLAMTFGAVGVGILPAPSIVLKIHNVGLGALGGTVGALAPPFAVTAPLAPFGPIAPGGTQNVVVQFTPTAAGPAVTTLVITTAPAVHTLNVPVSGIGRPGVLTTTLALLGETLSFGPVSHTGAPNLRRFKIQNIGKGVLAGNVPALGGTFTVTAGSGPFNLMPGLTKKVTVQFAPTGTGPFSQPLAITVTAPGKPAAGITVTLKGRGT